MNKKEKLYKEYDLLKEKYLKNKSINLKEDLKDKLIELDYVNCEEYELKLDTDFPMTTTLEKEKNRLEKLVSFIEDNINEQNRLISDYKALTGDVLELSYLKHTDNLKGYKERLGNVKRLLSILKDIKLILDNPNEKDDLKLKIIKNKLMQKELLNLLYEFCLIDDLDIKNIDVAKLFKTTDFNNKISIKKSTDKKVELPKQVKKKIEKKEEIISKVELLPEIKPEVKPEIKKEIKKEEPKIEKAELDFSEETNVDLTPLKEEVEEEHEEKILTSMPIVDKIGSVVPVNVFESLEKAEEKVPDVVLPSNGLKDDENDIFVETKDLF